LHHGGAATLEDLFSKPEFEAHWQSGNANFLSGEYADQQREDLIHYLLALDYHSSATQTPDPDPNMDACPDWFNAPGPEQVGEETSVDTSAITETPSSKDDY
jgi:hypothetical protein